MKKEISYGIIPVRFYKNDWQVLLVRHQAGHWAFPKGHPYIGEDPQQTAERELKEETNLEIHNYLSSTFFTETYRFTNQEQLIFKTVHYLIALVKGEVTIQRCEIQDSQWLTLPTAHTYMTFKEGRHICELVEKFLKKLKKNFITNS